MNRKFLLSATMLLAFSGAAFAQSGAKKYADNINATLLKQHLSILASDAYEGRETGQKGSLMAADYISAYFKKLGLQAPVDGSYFQNVPLVERSIGEAKIVVNDQAFHFGDDFLMIGPGATNPLSLKESQFLFVGYGINSPKWNDLEGIDIKDKVVLMLSGEPMTQDGKSMVTGEQGYSDYTLVARKKLRELQAMQPKAILTIYPQFRSSMSKYSAQLKAKSIDFPQKAEGKDIPAVFVSEELANVLLKSTGKSLADLTSQMLSTGKPHSSSVNQAFELDFKVNETPVKAMNVLGYLPGTDLKDELLVISSHYDHIGIVNGVINNGADDDGSGTTSVLAMAKAFTDAQKSGNKPRRSILFLTFTGEEKGLLGSQWYSENPVFPMNSTITDLNIDMVGRIDDAHLADTNYIYLIGSDKLSTDLHKISEDANKNSVNLKLDYKYNDPKDPNRFYYRSDHYNFAKHGVPVIFYFNGVHADYHQPGDDVEKIRFELMAKRVQLVFNTAWDLANREKRPVVNVKNDFPTSR